MPLIAPLLRRVLKEMLQFTPNIALGGISGMESAATLANLLRTKLLAQPSGTLAHLTQHEISDVFQAYQKERIDRTQRIAWLSTFITRVHACKNIAFRGIARYVFPLATDSMVAAIFSEHIRKGVKLDYVPVNQQGGSVPWEDDDRTPSPRIQRITVMLCMGVFLMYYAYTKLFI
jgi:hypothetical protein